MPTLIDLAGIKFGHLLVLERDKNLVLKSGKQRTMWKCICDCGNTTTVSSQSLRQGTTVSCGCYGRQARADAIKPDDLSGKKFGRLLVIQQEQSKRTKSGQLKTRWLCRCDCGNEIVVLANQLKSGRTNSCGCLRKEMVVKSKRLDLTGKVFGKLTVIRSAQSKRTPTAIMSNWLCRCECGNVVEVLGSNLRTGNTTSCGCSRQTLDLTGMQFGCLKVLHRDYTNHTRWICLCECGKITSKYGGHLVAGTIRSCGCKARSSSEEIIASFLDDNGVSFISEYSFDTLRRPSTNALLRFDFALINADENVYALIEYQGPQHYQDLGEFGRMQREETDKLKKEFCKINNIPLYEIAYTDDIINKCKEILSQISHF